MAQLKNATTIGGNTFTVGTSTYFLTSGQVGIGTSTVSGSLLTVTGGNIRVSNTGYGIVFPDGTWQTTASTGGSTPGGSTGAIQYNTGSGFGGAETKLYYDSTNYRVGIGTGSALTTLDVSGNIGQNVVAVSGTSVNCSLGNHYTKTVSGATVFTFDSVPASRSYGFILELTNGGSASVTWPASVKWPGGTAPTLTDSGVDVLVFFTINGGTTWRGIASMLDSK